MQISKYLSEVFLNSEARNKKFTKKQNKSGAESAIFSGKWLKFYGYYYNSDII